MEVKLTDNSKAFKRKLLIHMDQIPFATSKAQNMAANNVAKAQRALAARKIDKPNPFTLNQVYNPRRSGFIKFAGKRSDKKNLKVELTPGFLFGEKQPKEWSRRINKIFQFAEEGGTLTPKRKYLPVPTALARKNKYGGVSKGYVKAQLNKKKTFQLGPGDGVPANRAGIYERYGRGGRKARMLVAWESRLRYGRNYSFKTIASRTYSKQFDKAFPAEFEKAIRSKR